MDTPFNSKKTIFLADDEYLQLQCFSEILADAGYEVRTATNGKFALRSIQQAPPDLVVLDVKMPGMSGYQIYHALQGDEKTRDIPVIFMSGMEREAGETEDLALNNVDYLLKPITFQELLTHIEQVFQREIDQDLN